MASLTSKMTIEVTSWERLLIQSLGEHFKPLPSHCDLRILLFVELCTTSVEGIGEQVVASRNHGLQAQVAPRVEGSLNAIMQQ